MTDDAKTTDTIPRASIQQLLTGLQHLASNGGRSSYDAVRKALVSASTRKAPYTRTALWTVARDVLIEMEKLRFASVGVLPRKLSDIDRLCESPCELTIDGQKLATLYREKPGQAYDAVLIRWLDEHPYFRVFISRLLQSPLYIPDFTNLRQLGLESGSARHVEAIGSHLIAHCESRLSTVGWSADKLDQLKQAIEHRLHEQRETIGASDIDAKRLIDLIQDTIVLPAFLEIESLPFDAVTLSQILKCSQEFLAATWTASHPQFTGRLVFSTCDFDAPLLTDTQARVTRIIHHGVTYAAPRFAQMLKEAYIKVAGPTAGYANAYVVRALVCVELHAPLTIFSRCLETLVAEGPEAGITIYTELPFEPPPQGEEYIELGRRRIGRIKII